MTKGSFIKNNLHVLVSQRNTATGIISFTDGYQFAGLRTMNKANFSPTSLLQHE